MKNNPISLEFINTLNKKREKTKDEKTKDEKMERGIKKDNSETSNNHTINVYDEQYKNLSDMENEENDENENTENLKEWKPYHENILIDWADKALCYRWLHSKSYNKYSYLRNMYTIPVIILSTLTGTANFALERVPEAYQSYCQIGIGSLNILAGIITTISQFLHINELAEAHRVSSISWDKFYRNIRVELVKCPEDRTDVTYLIKSCKDEYDRLMESNPNIDKNIIKMFNDVFKLNNSIDNKNKKEAIKSLSKPEILDSLESTRNTVYKEKVKNKNDQLLNVIKVKKEQQKKEVLIDNFVETFKKEYSRKPSVIEIYDNLDTKVSSQVLDKYLSSNKWLQRK